MGGVRLPQIDAPVCTYYSYSHASMVPDGKNGLFGHTVPFAQEKLVQMYGSLQEYHGMVEKLAAECVTKGFLLQEDMKECIENAVDKAKSLGLH